MIRSHTFRGKRYGVLWKSKREMRDKETGEPQTGLCDDPKEPEKEIWFQVGLSDRELLLTAIDEGIHACLWDLDNDSVDQMSDAIGSFLWRLGFRRITQ